MGRRNREVRVGMAYVVHGARRCWQVSSRAWGLCQPHNWPWCFLPLASLVGWCWRRPPIPQNNKKSGSVVPASHPAALAQLLEQQHPRVRVHPVLPLLAAH